MPIKQMRLWDNKPCWITTEIIELINEHEQSFLDAYEDYLPASLVKARSLKTDCHKAIRIARADFVKRALTKNQSNVRKFWGDINSLIKQKAALNWLTRKLSHRIIQQYLIISTITLLVLDHV